MGKAARAAAMGGVGIGGEIAFLFLNFYYLLIWWYQARFDPRQTLQWIPRPPLLTVGQGDLRLHLAPNPKKVRSKEGSHRSEIHM